MKTRLWLDGWRVLPASLGEWHVTLRGQHICLTSTEAEGWAKVLLFSGMA